MLTSVMLFWLTATAGSSARMYYEDARAEPPAGPTTVPLGVAVFAHDFQSMHRFAERDHQAIVHWSEFDSGGHSPGVDSPDLLTADLRKFVRRFR